MKTKMNHPAAELRGIKAKKQGSFTPMQSIEEFFD
jgi:hypothetical protein